MARRRARGEGTVYKRGDRWEGALQVDGVRRRVSGRTRAETLARLAELKAQARDAGGRLPDPGDRSVGDLLDQWLAANASRWKARTLSDNTRLAVKALAPLRGIRLDRLEPAVVQGLVNGLLAEGKGRTAQVALARLRQALDLGVAWGWLASNPAARVVRPRHRAERKELWTPEELARFLRSDPRPLHRFLLTTGCRVGEALALRWEDLSLDATPPTARVERTGQHLGSQWVVSTPKTAAGRRTISLPQDLVAALRGHRARQAETRLRAGGTWEDHGLVFCGATGRPLHASAVGKGLKGACARLGIRPVSPHGLRHLHASLLLDQGLSLPEVSRRLGHANPAITAQVYSHVVRGDDRAATAAIERALQAVGAGG